MTKYVVEYGWFDKMWEAHYSYENGEKFDNLEDAQRFYNAISLSENEYKELILEIDGEIMETIEEETTY